MPLPILQPRQGDGQRPLSVVLSRLEELGCRPRGRRNGSWAALCPGHDDRRPSLSLREADDGRALLKCHAGCPPEAVLERLGLSWADLFPERERRNGHQPEKRQAQQPADPLSWWAERCGVPRGWLEKLPLEARDDAVAFTWPGLETAKLRSPELKGLWDGDGPRPPLWPALPEAMPPVIVLCEGESDATVGIYVIEAAGLVEKVSVHALTKGAAATPEALGIADLDRPDWGDPVPVYPGEVPVFWTCGVTLQAVAPHCGVELMITHALGHMFVTDLRVGWG